MNNINSNRRSDCDKAQEERSDTKEDFVKVQDFENPDKKENKEISSHGEVINQKHGDFSELEKSRMDAPPDERESNGSDKQDTDNSAGSINQKDGV